MPCLKRRYGEKTLPGRQVPAAFSQLLFQKTSQHIHINLPSIPSLIPSASQHKKKAVYENMSRMIQPNIDHEDNGMGGISSSDVNGISESIIVLPTDGNRLGG